MREARWLAFLLVLGLSSLRTLVCASPPDPLWVPGLYDDADYDDVAAVVFSLEGIPDDPPPTLGRPASLVMGVAVPSLAYLPSAPRPSQESRAPPLS